jgi:hypothetical protein
MIGAQPYSVGRLFDRAITIAVRNAPLLLLLSAAGVAPLSAWGMISAAVNRGAANPNGWAFFMSMAMLVLLIPLLLLCVWSWLAVAVAVDAISRGEQPTAIRALRESLGALASSIGVGLRYVPGFVGFGIVATLCLSGIMSGITPYVVLGALGCIALLVPYSVAISAATVAMFHRVLRSHHPGSEHFEGGTAVTSFTARNVLAAVCGVGITYTGYYAVQFAFLFGSQWIHVPAYVEDFAQLAVILVANVVSAAFFTLFYQDLLAESVGADLLRDAARLREEQASAAQ